MSNIDKQARAGDESMKTYYIHPMAFGSTQDPGHGHVAVVKAAEAEKRIAELEAREVKLPERYEVEMCPTPSPDGDWYSREDVLAALATAGVRACEEGEHG